ncbi:MAG: hypothetical protein C0504_19535 [Candidatus Solibacter sp.]|nr:hypothetical protein [Candidatus Solibacter sp.]
MTADTIAKALRLRRVGQVWRGPCPLHGGKSFTVTERDGRVLLYCWSGCSQGDLLGELRRRGLWPERERKTFSAAERRDYGRKLRSAEREAEALLVWTRDLSDWMALESIRAWFWFRLSRRVLVGCRLPGVQKAAWADLCEQSEEWGRTMDAIRDGLKLMPWADLNRVRCGREGAR